MENIFITLIYSCVFIFSLKYILHNHKDLFIENKKTEEEKAIEKSVEIIINQIKKMKETIKNIAKKIPFTGEEWQQEIVKEDIDNMMTTGVFEEIEERSKVFLPALQQELEYMKQQCR